MKQSDSLSSMDKIPSLVIDGENISLKKHIEPGSSTHSFIGNFVLLFAVIVASIPSYGIVLVLVLIAPIIAHFNRKKVLALIEGSGLRVGPKQFPEIYECAKKLAVRMGMKHAPDIYIIEGNVMQSTMIKIGGRGVMLLVDDIVYACLASGEPKALSFVIARDMAQHALKHTGLLRSAKRLSYKKLARLDEFTYDNIANALVGDSQVAVHTVTTLLAGPQLLKYVNLEEIIMQAQEVDGDKYVKKAVSTLPHPALMQRIVRFLK